MSPKACASLERSQNNFYDILGIHKSASKDDIKKAYKKLVLQHHPDKNKSNNAKESFHQIQMAYEILYDDEKRKKYDGLTPDEKFGILDTIQKIINDIVQFDNIMDDHIKGFILKGEYKYIKDYIIQKINQKYVRTDESDIFIPSKATNHHGSITFYNIMENASGYETSISSTHTSERNISLTINTTLEEIYLNKLKEITILRNRINKPSEHHKILIPLIDDKLILRGEGDEYTKNDTICRSDIVIRIRCKKHHFIERVNDYDLMLYLPISLYELFNGFKKSFVYFDKKKITIASSNPLKEYQFDGEKITIEFRDYGLVHDHKRGSLFIILFLNKVKDFNHILKTYFSS